MQYFILRKIKIWGKDEYSIEAKAQHGYDSITEVTEKKVALETLNENKDVSCIPGSGTLQQLCTKSIL